MASVDHMRSLYKRLSSDLGVPAKYVRETLLPPWWDDKIGATKGGFAEATVLLSRNLGVDLKSLMSEGAPITFSAGARTKYKLPKDRERADVALVRSIAERLSRSAALATEQPYAGVGTAKELRAQILGQRDSKGSPANPWVSLKALASHCWSIGIPVLFLRNLPPNQKKMHGMTVRIGERPVIVICKKGAASWLLFILAHELGHVAHGHIEPDTLLIDEEIEQDSDDAEEAEANRFAIELLTGRHDTNFSVGGQWPRADRLAALALAFGTKNQVEPGHIALNYAFSMGRLKPASKDIFYKTANAAVKALPDQDGGGTLSGLAEAHLRWSELPEASAEFLASMTGVQLSAD